MECCAICSDAFNEKTKRPISCPYCAAQSCFGCMKKCALLWASDPKCAHCNKKLESSFIDAVFPKGFRRGQLRIQAIKNLLEQEMSLLPQSAVRLEQIKVQERIGSYFVELKHITDLMRSSPYLKFPLERLAEIEIGLKDCKTLEKKTVVRKTTKCPTNECRGYIPTGLKCTICFTFLCTDCNVPILSEEKTHACNLDDITSWTAIKDSTVPCPKCSMRIEKISGCNQMWCTIKNCNTAFDWATGKIINGPMHNPHYHEYLRTLAPQAQNNDILACEAPRNKLSNARINEIYYYFRLQMAAKQEDSTIMSNFLRANIEAFDYERPIEDYGPRTYEKLRFNYLDAKISKDQWASRLSCKETLRIKKKKLHELKNMYQTAASDIFAKFYFDTKTKFMALGTNCYVADLNDLQDFNQQNESLRIYYEKEMRAILADYSDVSAKVLVREGSQIQWSFIQL